MPLIKTKIRIALQSFLSGFCLLFAGTVSGQESDSTKFELMEVEETPSDIDALFNKWSHCRMTLRGDERIVDYYGCGKTDANPRMNVTLINEAIHAASTKIYPIIVKQVK